MTVRLFIRPQPPTAETVEALEWCLCSFGGERIGGGRADQAQLDELLSQYSVDDVLVHFIVPASDFSYVTAVVPAKQARHIQQALPYLIEDAVAEDIEAMHLVPGEKLSKPLARQSGKQHYPVLVTRRSQMQHWYDAVKGLKLPLQGIYVDAELCRSDAADITVLLDDDDALVYAHGLTCLRTHAGNLPVCLEALHAQLDSSLKLPDDPLKLTVLANTRAQATHHVLLAELAQIEGIRTEVSTFSSSAFDVLCASWFNLEKPVNLCCPQFPGNAQLASSGFRKWWPLAAVACLWFIIQISFDLAEGFLHHRQASEYRQQSVAIYQQLFPGERTIASPRRQLEGKLRNASNSSTSSGFLEMLGEAGYQLSLQPQQAGMTLNNMQYSETRGELAMEISAPSLDDLDRYKQSISAAGYQVTIGSAIKEDNSVRGKLTVQGG